MLSSTALTLLSVALVSASPAIRSPQPISAPLTKYTKPGATTKDIIAQDYTRLSKLKGGATKRSSTYDATVTNAVVSYLTSIVFGGSSTTYELILDTGSSNTWVGSDQKFTCESPCESTGDKFEIEYGSGEASGTEATDTVTLVSGLEVTGQYIGIATSTEDFEGVDGILGVGPEDLTEDTVSGISEQPTVVQNAYSQGLIPEELLGVYFAPTTTEDNNANGVITYGGTDTSLYTGSIVYETVAGEYDEYWGIEVPIYIGSTDAGTYSGIVDTGTTLVYLPTTAYNDYIKAIPSATLDEDSGLVRFPTSSLDDVPTVYFDIDGTKFGLNSYAQLVEQGLYDAFGLSSEYYYSWINDADASYFIAGQKFLERYYAVFDTTNNRVGFATTANSDPTSVP